MRNLKIQLNAWALKFIYYQCLDQSCSDSQNNLSWFNEGPKFPSLVYKARDVDLVSQFKFTSHKSSCSYIVRSTVFVREPRITNSWI